MKNENLIIYLDYQDILTFCSGHLLYKEAYAYEWENENVIHIHLSKKCHQFGQMYPALFAIDNKKTMQDKQFRFHVFIEKILPEPSVSVFVDGVQSDFYYIPDRNSLFSRNKGLLEKDVLKSKKAMIIGLGSFGAQIAVELAKAGVGKFSLFDFDRIELHNLARHIATVNDLGRLKTDVVEDAILGKNPYALVDKFPIDIDKNAELLSSEVGKSDIVICATDNNSSRLNLSKELVKKNKVGIFGRAVTRAAGGDVFRYRPGGACYACLIGHGIISKEEISSVQAGRLSGAIPAYTSDEDAQAVVQVGLAADISPICNMMIKLALLELSKGTESGIQTLEDDLVYDCYIWANRREYNFKNWHVFYQSGADRTIMRWYGVKVHKLDGCPVCSTDIILDTGQKGEYHDPENSDYEGLALV